MPAARLQSSARRAFFPAVIADYGKAGCSHLELRHGNLYDCEIPDMNLRRIVLYGPGNGTVLFVR